jgi:hypothetical protein
MHVDVDVRDTMSLVLQPLARDRGVVVRAEPGRTVAVGMVEAA